MSKGIHSSAVMKPSIVARLEELTRSTGYEVEQAKREAERKTQAGSMSTLTKSQARRILVEGSDLADLEKHTAGVDERLASSIQRLKTCTPGDGLAPVEPCAPTNDDDGG